MKRSRQISGRILWEGYTTFWCFSRFIYGVTLKIGFSVYCRVNAGGNIQNRQRGPPKYHFGNRWQVRPAVWTMPANYVGEPEDAANIREVGASVARRRTEAAACV